MRWVINAERRDTIGLFDKKKNTLAFIGITDVKSNYIELKNGDCLVYFRIQPKNISAMPKEKIQKEIEGLKTVIALSGYNLELSVFSSYENYDDVVQNYYDKAEEYRKENPKDIRIELLSEDIRELYEINATRSGAKEFYIILRLNIAQRRDMDNAIMKTEKLIAEGDFNVKLSQGDELFDIIQVYLENFRA